MEEWGLNAIKEAAEVIVGIRYIVGKVNLAVLFWEIVLEIESVKITELSFRE